MAKVTIKMIAEIAGVSRGTVDRVLNGRPYVKKDVAEKVRRVAEELNYTPDPVAKALKSQKKANIGVIVPPKENELFVEVRRGIRRAQREYEEYGISLELLTMKKYTIEEQVRLLQEIEKKHYFHDRKN
jgi:LacI family transcriptional regulator